MSGRERKGEWEEEEWRVRGEDGREEKIFAKLARGEGVGGGTSTARGIGQEVQSAFFQGQGVAPQSSSSSSLLLCPGTVLIPSWRSCSTGVSQETRTWAGTRVAAPMQVAMHLVPSTLAVVNGRPRYMDPRRGRQGSRECEWGSQPSNVQI